MENKHIDRRVQRTRKLLSEALLELCLEKPYDKITIQDVLDRGNFGRSTFYSHFRNKDDLLLSCLVMENFMSCKPGHPGVEMSEDGESCFSTRNLFQHVQENGHFYNTLLGGRGIELVHNTGYERLREFFTGRVEAHFPVAVRNSPLGLLIPGHLAITLLHLLIWYIKADMPYKPERMDEIFRELVVPGIMRLLGTETD